MFPGGETNSKRKIRNENPHKYGLNRKESKKKISGTSTLSNANVLKDTNKNGGEKDAQVCKDAYVHCRDSSHWGFSSRIKGKVVADQNGADMFINSSIMMDVATIGTNVLS